MKTLFLRLIQCLYFVLVVIVLTSVWVLLTIAFSVESVYNWTRIKCQQKNNR